MDVTLRHDFVGAGHNGLNQGQLRNPDNPDKLLDSAAADKIRHIAPRTDKTDMWPSCQRV